MGTIYDDLKAQYEKGIQLAPTGEPAPRGPSEEFERACELALSKVGAIPVLDSLSASPMEVASAPRTDSAMKAAGMNRAARMAMRAQLRRGAPVVKAIAAARGAATRQR